MAAMPTGHPAAAIPAPPPQAEELSGNVTLSGAWALYPMALKWAEEFQKVHPKVRVDIQAGGAGKGIADALAGIVDFGMVSREIQPAETQTGRARLRRLQGRRRGHDRAPKIPFSARS